MVADPAEVARHHDYRPESVERLVPEQVEMIEVVDADPTWPAQYAAFAARLTAALGERVEGLEHVGSTAVAGLAAKPVLDVDLTVVDPRDEAAYVPPIEALGLTFVLREPSWHEHRVLRREVGPEGPRINLHVWGPDSPEVARHLILRDWLRTHSDDRDRYAVAKRAAATATNAADGGAGGVVMDYNLAKQPVIRAILDEAFAAHGLRDG